MLKVVTCQSGDKNEGDGGVCGEDASDMLQGLSCEVGGAGKV
jgi:hypothetical protein